MRLLLSILIVPFAMLLLGCSQNVSIDLSRTEITLYVGERRDILPYLVFSPAIGEENIVLRTESECVKVDGTAVVGVKAGSAEIIISARGKTFTMTVNVDYSATTDFFVTVENRIQTASNGEVLPVIFTAEFYEYNPQLTVQWKTSDGITYSGRRFEYMPRGYGEYTVTAVAYDTVWQYEVKVYRRTDVTVRHADLAGVSAFVPITFTADENVNTLNPKSVYEWRVNGEVAGSSAQFTFTPEIGKHSIALFVNGEQKTIDGKSELTFDVSVDNHDDCKVTFDDTKDVYIRYSKGRNPLYISIIDTQGVRHTFDVTDAQYSHLFSDGAFRATEYIDVCAQNPMRYIIMIGTDGERYEFDFLQLSADVQQYLDDKVFLGNSFISDTADAKRYVSDLYAVGATEGTCYAAGDVLLLKQAMLEQAEMLGLSVSAAADGNVIRLVFQPYVNAPDKNDSSTVNTAYAILPHIEYNDDNRRSKDYIFPSDRLERSVAVSGSEQLVIAVLDGYKPITRSGDNAYVVYRAAKSVLLNIIGADYTARQKVHAVYDWLQSVTVNKESAGMTSVSRFAEGVFAAVRSAGSGYAVTSEGLSKAFALLCAVEGIECKILRNTDYGYYNKVKLDGVWFVTDVYGGKIKITMQSNAGLTTAIEYTSHRGLLISDREFAGLGCDVNDGYEAFDKTNSQYMQKQSYDNLYFDNYIDKSEIAYQAVKNIVYFALNGTVRGNTRIPYVGSYVIIYNNTYGVEIKCDPSLTESEISTVAGYINKAIDEYASDVLHATFAGRRTVIAGGIICAIAVSPIPLSE